MCNNCNDKEHKQWVNLHAHTEYSLLDGYAKIEDYIKVASERGDIGLGISDHGTCSGLYELITQCNEAGLKPIPGFEAYVAPENPEGAFYKKPVFYGKNGIKARNYDVGGNGAHLHLTLFAYNDIGLKNLMKLTSLSWSPDRFYQKPRIDTDLLFEYNEGLIVTTGCPSSEISTRFLLGQDEKAYEYASRLKSVFEGRMYVEVMDHAMENEDLERILLPKLRKLASDLDLPFLATNDCHYVYKDDADAHERMLAMQTDSKMSEPTFSEGGTRFAFSGPEYYMKSDEEMRLLFPEELYPGAVDNTYDLVMNADHMKLEYDTELRPEIEIPEGYDEITYLKKLVDEGFRKKRGNASIEVQRESIARIKHEFEVIESNDFINYFLVVEDYIREAHDRNIPVGKGRGCFMPGSLVTMDSGNNIPIEDVASGDYVKTYDHEIGFVSDTKIYEVTDEVMTRIHLNNGKTIECTSDHLILTLNNGYVRADELTENAVLLTNDKAEESSNEIELSSLVNYPYSSKIVVNNEEVSTTFMSAGLHRLTSFAESTGFPFEINRLGLQLDESDVPFITPAVTLENGGEITNLICVNNDMIESTNEVLETFVDGERFLIMTSEATINLLLGHNNYTVGVKSVETFEYSGPVYDLEVEDFNNYIINDVIVHNSVGGSEIAYVLDISDTDPIKYDLLFERFLSPGRGSTYSIEYEDGEIIEVSVSDKVKVINLDNEEEIKYVHQLKNGEAIIEIMEKETE